jgi:hypothetical protein
MQEAIVDLEMKDAATSTIHKALQSGVGSSCSGDIFRFESELKGQGLEGG